MAELVAGRNNVMAALEAERPIIRLFVANGVRGGNIQALVNLARARGCPVQFVPRQRLAEMAKGLNHQGILAETAAWQYADFDQLLASVDIAANPILLMLAGVEDPHNLGALLRTAECAGVSGVVLPERRSAQLTAAVARVSMGAIETVPVARVGNVIQAIAALKAKGYWVAAADMDGESYWQLDWKFPVVLILGGEGRGVPRLVKEKSDYLVSIPTRGRISSLNVSVAGAVLLYEILRQRIAANGIPNS